jgi:Ser/Thr protein kinase RdoA (MazF antagonist)
MSRPLLPPGAAALLSTWCHQNLGSRPTRHLFKTGHLSAIVGVELEDGRQVVVKIREAEERVAACVDVQRHLRAAGYPCPELLAGPARLGALTATAEALVAGGEPQPASGRDPQPYARALARLVPLASGAVDPPRLLPAPPWVRWDHAEGEIWPKPDDFEGDLNADAGPAWLDEAGRAARERLRQGSGPLAIGHCDWYTGNLRWNGDDLHVVHDWDSVIADREPLIAGFASAVFCTIDAGSDPSVEESAAFLETYQRARDISFSGDEIQEAWAAGLWIRAYDAKKQAVKGEPIVSLTQAEANNRRGRMRQGALDRRGEAGAAERI